MSIQGDAGDSAPVEYKPPDGTKFRWPGSIAGAQHGGLQPQDNGDVLKVFTCRVKGPTPELVARGVTELQRNAIVTVHGVDWSIDLIESLWGENVTILALVRRPIAQHQEIEAKFDRR